jgi:hypothetical protein
MLRDMPDSKKWKILEKEYWKFVDHNVGETIVAEYAADLVANKYGSGFPHKYRCGGGEIGPSDNESSMTT